MTSAAVASASAEPAGCAARSVLVSGVTADHPVGRLLARAFGGAVRFVVEPWSWTPSAADVAVSVFRADDGDAADPFEAWAFRAGVPTLGLCLAGGELRIGPVTLAGHAGCGRCARDRITGARAGAAETLEAHAVMVEDRPAAARASTTDELPEAAAAVAVREIAAVVAGPVGEARLRDHVMICKAASGATVVHRVIPLSRCRVCGGAAAWPTTAAPCALSADAAPEAVLAALAGWLDPRTGVISRITLELSGETGSEPPVIVTASPPCIVGARGELRRLPIGWGKGMTVSGALLSAVGEAVERYAASLPDPARIVWARPDELDHEYLDPGQLALYTDEQYAAAGFPFRRFAAGARHPWVLGRWLGSDAPVWVPAVLAFLSLTLHPENQICQGTSNGLAASGTTEDGALRATLELVERDAFMTTWLTGRPARRVELDDTLDPELHQVVAGIAALGAQVEVFVLPTSACGTTALCLALGDGDRYPGVTLGLGADLEPRAAVRQAILELAQTGPHLRRLMRARALAVPAGPEDVHDMLDHAAYYFPAGRAGAFDRLRGATSVTLRELGPGAPRSLAGCATALAAAGIRVALVDVTPPDVATGPFRVVRAISPDLQPLSYGHGFDHPPVDRIRSQVRAGEVPPIHPLW